MSRLRNRCVCRWRVVAWRESRRIERLCHTGVAFRVRLGRVALDGTKIAERGTRSVPVEEHIQLRAAARRLARAGTGLQHRLQPWH
ncbi:MAG: hypothetical protein QOE71_3453 [Pseudonocardiales bacterium]|nr:hypothetical protein [Pseudonocardiales bacterium]